VISWRYHLVSIVAVFLALGLGVLTGTTVLNDNLVRNLRAQTRTLRADLDDLRGSVVELQAQLDTMDAFAEQAMPFLVGGRLATRKVVVVTQEGVDGQAIAQLRRALDLAGAEVLTTLTVRPSMAATSPEDQRGLAALLGLSASTPSDQLATASAQALAGRLARDPAGDPQGADLLGALLSQGFLTASAPSISDSTLAQIGGRSQIVVAVGGGTQALAPESSVFMVPFVQASAALGVVTGAGESLASDGGFVPVVRSTEASSGGPLVTVDDVDVPVGSSAMVLGLREAVLRGAGGDYGVKAGASRLLPASA